MDSWLHLYVVRLASGLAGTRSPGGFRGGVRSMPPAPSTAGGALSPPATRARSHPRYGCGSAAVLSIPEAPATLRRRLRPAQTSSSRRAPRPAGTAIGARHSTLVPEVAVGSV